MHQLIQIHLKLFEHYNASDWCEHPGCCCMADAGPQTGADWPIPVPGLAGGEFAGGGL